MKIKKSRNTLYGDWRDQLDLDGEWYLAGYPDTQGVPEDILESIVNIIRNRRLEDEETPAPMLWRQGDNLCFARVELGILGSFVPSND